MSEYTLQRSYSPAVTLGMIYNNGLFLCATAELPWLDNEPGQSCIPEGTYACIRHDSAAHPHVWEVTGVPGRSGILIHNGNIASDVGHTDSLGCILVGNTYGMVDGKLGVINSNATLAMLRTTLPDTFSLTILKHP